MNTFIDLAGREVRVGDFIVYGSLLGRCAGLQFGRVLDIKSREERLFYGSREKKTVWRIKVQGVSDEPSLLRPGTLMYPDRILCINEIIPAKLKELLLGAK
jgi:hypothetical protein